MQSVLLPLMVKELQHGLVAAGVPSFDARVCEVGTRGHSAMHLVGKGLGVVGHRELGLEFRDGFYRLLV